MNIKVFALGGLNEVGKNCYIIEKNKDLIIIDCGIKFLNDNYNLANGIIPNFTYLKENKERIKGLFITHGHEDHIGGIPFLLEEIGYDFPLYGSAFALALVKKKLGSKASLVKSTIFSDEPICTAEFRVSVFRVTHSIPGSFGLIIETTSSRIVATGDFKFDWTEIGEKTDLVKLAEAGKKGVDLLLSDSTNAEVPGTTPTEQKVISRLETIIFQALGRVIITSFASNVYRLKKIIDIAKKCGRKILLLGSSLNRYKEVIQKVSLWKIDNSIFVGPLDKKISSDKLIIFCTGSQGEAKAVLSRLAHQIYPGWKIKPGDTIILTSSPIMDNRYNLERINNKLSELGAIIYENSKEELLHASGHACQEDLKLMLTLVNPRYFMPFHGDFRMLKAHEQLAREIGVAPSNIFVCQNGEVVQAKEETKFNEKRIFSNSQEEKSPLSIPKIKFFLTSQRVLTNPNYVFGSKTIQEGQWKENLYLRQQMSRYGVIVVIFFYNQAQQKFVMPCFFTYGFINMEKNKSLVQSWKEKLYRLVNNLERLDLVQLKKKIETKIFELLSSDLPKSEPLIISLIENL